LVEQVAFGAQSSAVQQSFAQIPVAVQVSPGPQNPAVAPHGAHSVWVLGGP
jgi:hypothetical protein